VTELFATSAIGDNLDVGYLNLRASQSPVERDMVQTLEAMWAQYEPYADPDFVEAFARDPDSRFWELAIGYALLDAGKTLLATVDRPRNGGHPDLCVLEQGRRIWIEAIAPTIGESGVDQIPELVPLNEGGGFRDRPTRADPTQDYKRSLDQKSGIESLYC